MSDCEDDQSVSLASSSELERMEEIRAEDTRAEGSARASAPDASGDRLPISRLIEILSSRESFSELRMSREVLATVEDAVRLLQPVLRQQMNFCNPANWVPPEILALIFSQCVDPKDSVTWPHCRLKSNRGLRGLTHVCRRWRAVALATPLLWANIYDRPELAGERNSAPVFLERSLHVPLNVFIGDAPSDLLRGLIRENSERIRQLYIKPKSYYDLETISGLAPNVEHLTMRRTSGKANFPRPKFFDEEAPRLSSVALFRVQHLPGMQVHSLTHLAIVDPGESSSWTSSELFSLLELNSNLEEIFLEGLSQLAPLESTSASTPIIHLPHLRRLILGDFAHANLFTFLLQHIRGSHSTATLVRRVPIHTGRCQLSDIPHLRPLSCLHLRAESDATMTITGSDGVSAVRVERTSVPFIFFSQDEDWLKRENRADSLWVRWPLEELEELWITGPPASHNAKCLEIQGGVKTMLDECPRLATITLAFLHNSEKPEPDLSLGWLLKDAVLDACPDTLRTLRLWIDAVPGSKSSMPVREIVNFAARRKANGCPIHRLVVESGPRIDVGPEDVQDWATLASYVDVLEVRLRVENPPQTKLPDICTKESHALWPTWGH